MINSHCRDHVEEVDIHIKGVTFMLMEHVVDSDDTFLYRVLYTTQVGTKTA